MIPRPNVRDCVATLLAVATACALPGCQNDEADNDQVCAYQCDYLDANAFLSVADVVQIIANAIVEANANGISNLTIVVNDHLNNVLAVDSMTHRTWRLRRRMPRYSLTWPTARTASRCFS